MRPEISEETANWIWDVLIARCGASNADIDRTAFVYHATERDWTEYRFMGSLGFGGKVWNNAGRFYVTCYREDETKERCSAIEATNTELAEIYEETYGSSEG